MASTTGFTLSGNKNGDEKTRVRKMVSKWKAPKKMAPKKRATNEGVNTSRIGDTTHSLLVICQSL